MSQAPPGPEAATVPLTAVTTHWDDGLTTHDVPVPLQAKPPGHAPHVRPIAAQTGSGSRPHIRPEHIGTHTSEISHRPAALHIRPSAHVPHWPPHPSEPHSRPAQTGVQMQRPLVLQAELAEHMPHVRPFAAQFMPRSGPHSRPAHADIHVSLRGTQRPAVLHSQPVSGHVPQEPPAPLGPHSRPAQVGGMVTRVHEPLVHASPATQALSQLPQCAVSVRVLTQPPPQTVRPDGQAHAPATQLCPVGQRVPHPPQWRVSLCGSTHAAAHIIRGARHPDAQVPFSQLDPAPQAVPHAPQFSPSVWTFTQRPAQSAPEAEGHAERAAEQRPPRLRAGQRLHRTHDCGAQWECRTDRGTWPTSPQSTQRHPVCGVKVQWSQPLPQQVAGSGAS
jgi:hypothetical protein